MTGIKDDRAIKSVIERRRFSSLEEEVNSFAAREIRANPSQDFWYGSIGPNLAGRVIEVISKKRFDVVIKQKLFNPLEMRRTTFTSMDGSATNPAGGAQSTAEDYMKFLMMLLNKGKYKNKQILSEESVNTLMQIQTKPEIMKFVPEAAKGYNYTLGSWAVEGPDSNSPGGGKATVLASPGLFGTWPMVDFCRGYAYLFFVKTLLSDEKAEEHKKLKAIIDEQMPSTCN
jgi:CubicO group peptidase (beta-lactamase class C family)